MMIDYFKILSSLFVGGTLGGLMFYFIHNRFSSGLEEYVLKYLKSFEEKLEQSQISAFEKINLIQNEQNQYFGDIVEFIKDIDNLFLDLYERVDNFKTTLHNLNVEIKNNADAKKELESEIVKLKSIINRLQKKRQYE